MPRLSLKFIMSSLRLMLLCRGYHVSYPINIIWSRLSCQIYHVTVVMSKLSCQACQCYHNWVFTSRLSRQGYRVNGPLASLVDSRRVVCETTLILSGFVTMSCAALSFFVWPFYHFASLSFSFLFLSFCLFFLSCIHFESLACWHSSSSCRLRSREEQGRRVFRARRCLGPSQQDGTTARSTGMRWYSYNTAAPAVSRASMARYYQ